MAKKKAPPAAASNNGGSDSLDKFIGDTASVDTAPSVKALQAEVRDLKRKLAMNKSGAAVLVAAVQDVFADDPPSYDVPEPPPRKPGAPEEIAVLHLSDLQIGKTTATYDSAIAHKRLQIVGQKAVEIIGLRQKNANIKELHLLSGGDIIEGERIFPTQAHEIDQSLIRQACFAAPAAIIAVMRALMPMVETIHFHGVRGNHGRDDHGAAVETNWDTVVNIVTQQMGAPFGKRVTWDIAVEDWKCSFNTYGWRHLLCHGHQIRGMLGFPWYGFGKKVGGWYQTVEPFDYVWTGHFHTSAMFDINRITVLSNGTTESDNQYALESLAAGGSPKQRLAFFNKDYGLISDNQLFLDKRVPARYSFSGAPTRRG